MESSDDDDDAETVKRIEDTVRDVLEEMDMAGMVRAAAAQRLGIDLSVPRRGEVVQRVIDSFLQSLEDQVGEQEEQDQVQEEEKDEDEEDKQDQSQEEDELQDDEEEEDEEEEEEEEEEYEHDDAETTERIEETVWDILKEADTNSMTPAAVLAAASRRLGLDLSGKRRKEFVQSVINSFLIWMDYNDEEEAAAVVPVPVQVQVQEEAKEEEKQQEEDQVQLMHVEKEEGGEKRVLEKRGCECDDSDDPIIHGLSCKRRVILQELKRKTLLSICEFYEKDGEQQLPTSEGISLTVEQRQAFQKVLPQIEDAIKQLGDSID